MGRKTHSVEYVLLNYLQYKYFIEQAKLYPRKF